MGPTPKMAYVKERTHVTFRYWYDYSGGTMTDWGAHHHDIALWAMQLDRSGPISVSGRPLVEMIPGGFTAASEYVIEYVFPNGVTQTTHSTADDTWSGGIARKEGQRNGIKFHGTDGWIWVTRGDLQASSPEVLGTMPPKGDWQVVSQNHMQNLFDCIRTRTQPICDVEIGHRSASVCHLGVLAMRLGRPLKWDPRNEKFVDDRPANQWLTREMRKPYSYGYS
jgi:predicted dehydrogenase